MITLEQARERAAAVVGAHAGRPIVIVDDLTVEREFGWVFFYDSERFIATGDNSARLIGNSPVIVNRYTGGVSYTDTSLMAEEYISAYEALGAERYDAGEWREYLKGRFEPLDGE